MSPEMILAISALLTGLFAALAAYRVSKTSARKDEVVLLRDEVGRLSNENTQWRIRYNALYEYVLKLREIMLKSGLDAPPIPAWTTWTKDETDEIMDNARNQG